MPKVKSAGHLPAKSIMPYVRQFSKTAGILEKMRENAAAAAREHKENTAKIIQMCSAHAITKMAETMIPLSLPEFRFDRESNRLFVDFFIKETMRVTLVFTATVSTLAKRQFQQLVAVIVGEKPTEDHAFHEGDLAVIQGGVLQKITPYQYNGHPVEPMPVLMGQPNLVDVYKRVSGDLLNSVIKYIIDSLNEIFVSDDLLDGKYLAPKFPTIEDRDGLSYMIF